MTQRKMLLITAGALLLLLPWFGGLASGELSPRFAKCQKFFYNKIPPQGFGNRYQTICQLHKKQYRFATLYDRKNRTPLYSAYLLSPSEGKRPKDPWMYEPQLVSTTDNAEMQPCPRPANQRVKESQAVLEDYEGSNYTRGHLAPSLHLNTTEDREASFTLTNIVPQMNWSNSGTWRALEEKVLKRFNSCCNGTMYVITGVIPYKEVLKLNERVSIPEYIWSAYCCPFYKHNCTESVFFPTFAAMGSNDPSEGYAVRNITLSKLQRNLNRRLSTNVSLFYNNCPASKP